jgi:serine/threonine protein phosphatase PrpC
MSEGSRPSHEAEAGLLENVRVAARTEAGLHHRDNEDTYLVVDRDQKGCDIRSHGMMFAVADGMGGHASGQIASRMACRALLGYYHGGSAGEGGTDIAQSGLENLKRVIQQAHEQIQRYAEENHRGEGMGSTLSVLVLLGGKALIAHVGDSRIYRVRDSSLERLTEDHTLAQLSVEMGYLDPEEAPLSPQRHVLVQAIGEGVDEIQAEVESVEPGDLFLLCTDGLHHEVTDHEIMEILLKFPRAGDVCDGLVQRAFDRGGKDDVTVVLVRLEG